MNSKPLFFILICVSALSAIAETPAPKRDYTMVDLNNRLTTKMLDVGTTSFTFSIEWPLDIKIEYGWLDLIGKLDIQERGWHELTFLKVDRTQGKATFEIQFCNLWDGAEWAKSSEKKAFFAVRIPIPDDSPYGPSKGMYEEDDETDVMEGWWERDDETESPGEKPNRLWLYLALPLGVIGAVVYFMRKKVP